MRDVIKTALAKALCNPPDPHNVTVDDIYPHYVTFWDQVCEKWGKLLGNSEPPRNDRAIITAIADAFKERDERIAALEARIAALETPMAIAQGAASQCTVVSAGEPPPTQTLGTVSPKSDLRSRVRRERKKEQAQAAGV